MDTELLMLAADRLLQDYNGELDLLDIELGKKTRLKGDNRIHKITYEDGEFHFYHRIWLHELMNGENKMYIEVPLDEEEKMQVISEFYAWY